MSKKLKSFLTMTVCVVVMVTNLALAMCASEPEKGKFGGGSFGGGGAGGTFLVSQSK